MVWGILAGLAASAVGSLISGSGPSAPTFNKMPSPEDIKSVIDELTNTQVVTIKNADGTLSQKVSRLPRTPEEEEDYQKLRSTVKGVMGNLRTLLNQNPENAKRFEALIGTLGDLSDQRKVDLAEVLGGDVPTQQRFMEELNQFKERHTELQDDHWRRKRNAAEEQLIQSGHMDSSAANEIRANIDHQEGLARAKVNMDADKYGRELTQQDFENKFAIYDATRKQGDEDYKRQEEARGKDAALAEATYTGTLSLQDREIQQQKDLYKLNKDELEYQKRLEMNTSALAQYQNMYNNKMAQAQGDNAVKANKFNIDSTRHQSSWRHGFGKTLGYAGGKMLGNKMSDWGGFSDSPDDYNTDPIPSIDKPFKEKLGKFKFKI